LIIRVIAIPYKIEDIVELDLGPPFHGVRIGVHHPVTVLAVKLNFGPVLEHQSQILIVKFFRNCRD
jgi:hypothetical protein